MHAQGLLDDPDAPVTDESTLAMIERLGFVQLDSINIVERAHHHILWTRMHAYRPEILDRLQRAGRLFEHWTHDASIIPAQWFPHWRHRFGKVAWGAWLRRRIGRDAKKTLDGILERIRREGPLTARDFEHRGRRGGPWWDWKPAKAGLEYLWRRGDLAVPYRVRFEKVYDLTERVLPHIHSAETPPREAHTAWACESAMKRLGIATPREIAQFWHLIDATTAAAWCRNEQSAGWLVAARIEGDPDRRISFVRPDWREAVRAAPNPPRAIRPLSPFDPVIRDRARCQRLFGFEYRFEAFVPEARRAHGYYVLPVLRGDRLIGRIDPRLDRAAATLHYRVCTWEGGRSAPTAGFMARALGPYRELLNAERTAVQPP